MKRTKLLETVQNLFSSIMSVHHLSHAVFWGDPFHFFKSIHCYHVEYFESLKKCMVPFIYEPPKQQKDLIQAPGETSLG